MENLSAAVQAITLACFALVVLAATAALLVWLWHAVL